MPHLALIAVQLMFGSWPIVGKLALREISSTGLVALRVGGATLAFVLLQGNISRLWRIPRRDIAQVVLCAFLGVAANQLLFVKGLALTTVINATLLGTTIPVFTLLVSIALGHDRISLRRTLGIALAAGGVIYLIEPCRAAFSTETTVGNLLIVANSLGYGAYIALSKDLFARYGALQVITWIFLLGALLTVPVGAIGLSGGDLGSISAGAWLAVLYIVAVPTVGAYYLNAWALVRVSPSIVATYIYLQPLVAFGVAPMVLGERWSWRTLWACLLIFAGVAVVTSRGRSRAAKGVTEHPDALAH